MLCGSARQKKGNAAIKYTRSPGGGYRLEQDVRTHLREFGRLRESGNGRRRHEHFVVNRKVRRALRHLCVGGPIVLKKRPEGSAIDPHPIGWWARLHRDGTLEIASQYTWNGANVIVDDDAVMRGALVHDVLYQMLRELLLPDSFRRPADKVIARMYGEDALLLLGPSPAWSWRRPLAKGAYAAKRAGIATRRAYIYRALRVFGNSAAAHKPRPPVLWAPMKPIDVAGLSNPPVPGR